MTRSTRVQRVCVHHAPDQFHIMGQRARWGDGALAVCDREETAYLLAAAPLLLDLLIEAQAQLVPGHDRLAARITAAVARAEGRIRR